MTSLKSPGISVKWPGLLVQGDKITEDQANELLLRTSTYLQPSHFGSYADDALALVQRLRPELEPPRYEDTFPYDFLYPLKSIHNLENARINSSWVGGKHGWVDWDGSVRSNNYNIGKWPSAESVFSQWVAIARAFPWLNLRCQLLNCEMSEAAEKPAGEVEVTVEYVVSDGNVTMTAPEDPRPMMEVQGFDFANMRLWDERTIPYSEFEQRYTRLVNHMRQKG